jgi:DNA-binding beta-propeller fold protein YncE
MSLARMMQMAAAGVSAAGGDPYFSNVTCLLHFDGSNGGTTFADSSGNCTITGNANAVTTTAEIKYGSASLDCSAGNAYVYVSSASTGVMDFGTGDFTIECWIYRTSSGSRDFVCDTRQNTGNTGSFFLVVGTDNKLEWSANNISNSAKSTGTVPINQWVHLAVSREGTDIRLFIDGNLENTSTLSSSLVDDTNGTYPPIIATTGFTWGTTAPALNGYMDDFRVTKGVARYTASFTPPIEPFPDSGTSPAPAEWTDPDLANASYDSVSFSVAGQETSPEALFFKPDGAKMYVLGATGDDVNEYDLSIAWDISTASYVQNFSVASEELGPSGLFFKPDGSKMYITGFDGDDVNEYDLSAAWDVSTASFLQNFSVSGQDTAPRGLFFKPDGTKMYVSGTTNDAVFEYSLSIAWGISTASYVQSFSVVTQDNAPEDVSFNPDGDKMYIVGDQANRVYEYDLSTAWDISTATYNSISFGVGTQETSPNGVFFKSDGSKMYVVGSGTDTIYQYSTA